MGLTKLWILNGKKRVGEMSGNRVALNNKGIQFIEGEVNLIDVKNKEARAGNQRLPYDYLIIALGADYSPKSTPGFVKYAKDLYTESGCAEIRDTLQTFKTGSITVLVCGLPFKCPPAPYEASMIIDDVLRRNGVRDSVNLQVVTPEPYPIPLLGREAGDIVMKLLQERGIAYLPSQAVKEIRRDSVVTNAMEIQHDQLFGIPVHVAPSILTESGLANQTGWVPVDSLTLATNVPDVFAVGDCAAAKTPKGFMLPRAGATAEALGRVVAQNIIHEIRQEERIAKFDGNGVCFMEVGNEAAVAIRADFYAQPAPKWEAKPPSVEGYREKQRFLTDRMRAWFS
jgi:sulfide:quinone oxidoreductase